MRRFGAVGKFLRLLLEQEAGTLVLELGLNARPNFFKCRGRRRTYRQKLENYIALRNLRDIGGRFIGLIEDSIHE